MSTSTGDPDTTAWATLPIGDRRAIGQALKGLMRRRWLWLALLLPVLTAEAVCGFAIPIGLGRAVDAVSETSGAESLVPTIVIVAGGLVGAALFSALGVLVSAKLFEPMAAELREDVVRQALAIDQVTLERAGSGDLLTRAGEDVAAVTETLTGLVPRGLAAIVTLVAIMAGIITVESRLAIPLALTTPLYVHAIRFYLREAPPILGEARRMSGQRSQEVIGAFRGADTVKAFNLSDRAMARVEASTWAVVKYGLLTRIASNRFFTRLSIAELAGTLSILLAGILLIQFQHLAIGTVVTAVLLYLRVLEPISTILTLSEPIQVSAISMSRIVGVGQVRRRQPTPQIAPSKNEPGPGNLVARNLTFGFEPETPVLSGVNLDIPSGTTLAMVGASGAGKSTIAGLLAGIHEAWEGTIELDKRPLAERLNRVLLVSQETHLFDQSLRDNITLVQPDATDDQLEQVAQQLGIDWFNALPDGLDTTDLHHRLTPVQAQQLALARVALADADLLLLDEATADADSRAARDLENAMTQAIRGRSALVIAHRLGQAKSADQIVVMADGQIVQSGHHNDLVQTGGPYDRMWSAWIQSRDAR